MSLAREGEASGAAEAPKSRALPGDLGVFAEDPKEANAPVPRPKADEAPEFEEGMLVVFRGVTLLRGFDLPCDEVSLPNRFEDVKFRVG